MENLALNSFIFFCTFLGGKWGLAASKYTMLAADQLTNSASISSAVPLLYFQYSKQPCLQTSQFDVNHNVNLMYVFPCLNVEQVAFIFTCRIHRQTHNLLIQPRLSPLWRLSMQFILGFIFFWCSLSLLRFIGASTNSLHHQKVAETPSDHVPIMWRYS